MHLCARGVATHDEKLWVFHCYLRTARARTREAFGRMLTRIGRLALGFHVNSTPTGTVVAVAYDKEETAAMVHAHEAEILAAAGLTASDADFGPVRPTYASACAHLRVELMPRTENTARCITCGETVGKWSDYSV